MLLAIETQGTQFRLTVFTRCIPKHDASMPHTLLPDRLKIYTHFILHSLSLWLTIITSDTRCKGVSLSLGAVDADVAAVAV